MPSASVYAVATHCTWSVDAPNSFWSRGMATLTMLVSSTAMKLPIRQLPARGGLDASTVTRQVAALEADGFAERRVDPADRRCCLVEPSDRGRRLMGEVQRQRRERFEELLSGWSDADRADLARLLARLNRSINVPAHEGDAAEAIRGRVDAR